MALRQEAAAGLRLRLHEPRPDPRRLRQVALQHGLGRVQEHDARHRQRPPQVPVPEARLDAELQQRRPVARTTRTTCLPYTSAFDLQSSTTNQVKLYLDYNPMAMLGFSFEGNWAKQDYDNVTYGRITADRQGYFLTGNWGEADKLMLTAFGSWEEAKYPSDHRYIDTVSSGPNPPPGYCTTANPNCYSPAPYIRPRLTTAFLQLELGHEGHDLHDRRWSGLAGDAVADAEGVVPVRAERRTGDFRLAKRGGSDGGRPCRPGQPAQHRELRRLQAAVLQPEGGLRVQQELVVHGRLCVREIQLERHRHRRATTTWRRSRRRAPSTPARAT